MIGFRLRALLKNKASPRPQKKLGLSPSVISKRIGQLEKNLGVRLLQRNTRSLVLTEAGKIFYQHCSRIKQEVELTTVSVSSYQNQTGGLLRIHAPMSFGQMHLAPAISDFIKQHADIQVEIVFGNHLPNLIEQNFDVAISIKDLPDSSLVTQRIASRSIGIYGSPDYFARHGAPETPDDLKNHNCLLYQLHKIKHQWQFIDAYNKTFSVNVDGNFKANSTQALAKAAVAGLGIAKLSSFMVLDEIRQGKLINILKPYCRQDISVYAVYPHKNYLALKTKSLIEFLIARFAVS